MSVHGASRIIPRSLAVLLLVSVAILGFMSGHRSPQRSEGVREVSVPGGGLLYSPASRWRPASRAPVPPSLGITQQFALAPGGDASRGALIVGVLPSGSDPLPTAFVSLLRQRGETQVVYLANAQAYRFPGLALEGSNLALTLYTVPNSTSHAPVVVCEAPPAATRELHECEGIAANLTSTLPQPGVALTPDRHVARALQTVVGSFDRLRASLRPRISTGARVADVRALALQLADGATRASATIAALPAPQAAKAAQAALAESLTRTGAAYTGLAEALAGGNPTEYALARTNVDAAEAQVDAALADLALLGYEQP